MEGFSVSKCLPVSENKMNIELFVVNYSDFDFSGIILGGDKSIWENSWILFNAHIDDFLILSKSRKSKWKILSDIIDKILFCPAFMCVCGGGGGGGCNSSYSAHVSTTWVLYFRKESNSQSCNYLQKVKSAFSTGNIFWIFNITRKIINFYIAKWKCTFLNRSTALWQFQENKNAFGLLFVL